MHPLSEGFALPWAGRRNRCLGAHSTVSGNARPDDALAIVSSGLRDHYATHPLELDELTGTSEPDASDPAGLSFVHWLGEL